MTNNTVYLDLETTGLDPEEDEFIQIAIIDNDNKVLLNTLSRPIKKTSWKEAQEIHGISPEDVKDKPTNAELKQTIIDICTNKTIVIYNSEFDVSFISYIKDVANDIKCCMHAFARCYAEWSDYFNGYKWKSLKFASEYCLYNLSNAHNALADCIATRYVWFIITSQERIKKLNSYYKNRRLENEARWELEYMEHKQLIEAESYHDIYIKPAIEKYLSYKIDSHYRSVYTDKFDLMYSGYIDDVKKTFRRQLNAIDAEKLIAEAKKYKLPVFHGIKVPAGYITAAYSKYYNNRPFTDEYHHAIRVSKNKQKVTRLFEIKEIMKMTPVYKSWLEVPDGLYTKTRLKKELKLKDKDINKLPVVAIKFSSRSGAEYDLYDVGATHQSG